MSQKLVSQFGFLEVADTGSPGNWIHVGGVTAINDLRSGTATEIDVTDLDSLAKEYRMGLADNGTMTANVFYDPNDPGQVVMEGLRDTIAQGSFRVGIRNPSATGSPTGFTVFSYNGFVTSFPFSMAVDAAVTANTSVRITGAISKA